MVRSAYDVLPSPSNLVRWKVSSDNKCRCGKLGTLKHILSHCGRSLDRYTWRHNEVLKIIFDVTSKQIDLINSGKKPQKRGTRRFMPFLKEGQVDHYKKKVPMKNDENWDGSWKLASKECYKKVWLRRDLNEEERGKVNALWNEAKEKNLNRSETEKKSFY